MRAKERWGIRLLTLVFAACIWMVSAMTSATASADSEDEKQIDSLNSEDEKQIDSLNSEDEKENGSLDSEDEKENGSPDSEDGEQAVSVDLEDGEYFDSVILEGGSGRASVTSPCVLIVEDGKAYARIEWSSPYYDYMILDGETYLPVNEEGNSVFEIPVTVFDEPVTVIADTTAMSVPHEITYTLTFDGSLIQNESTAYRRIVPAVVIVIAILICVLLIAHRRRAPACKAAEGSSANGCAPEDTGKSEKTQEWKLR